MLQFKRMQKWISSLFIFLYYFTYPSIHQSIKWSFIHAFIHLFIRSIVRSISSFLVSFYFLSFFLHLSFFYHYYFFKFTFSLSCQQEKANVILPLQKLLDSSCFTAFHKVTATPVFQTFEDYVPARLRRAQSGSTAYMCT